MATGQGISKCGIYCGACYIYRGERDGGSFLAETARSQGVDAGEVRCDGCLGAPNRMWRNCRRCPVRACLTEKGHGFCHECEEFGDGSCEKHRGLARFCAERGEDARGSLLAIRENPERWLREQERRWSCPVCLMPYSWYESTCHHCGADLKRRDLKT